MALNLLPHSMFMVKTAFLNLESESENTKRMMCFENCRLEKIEKKKTKQNKTKQQQTNKSNKTKENKNKGKCSSKS